MVQVSEAMLLPLCKTKVCKECDSTACYARHQVQGMRPLFIPCPLSYAVCVCVYAHINFCLWTMRPPSVYGQRVDAVCSVVMQQPYKPHVHINVQST